MKGKTVIVFKNRSYKNDKTGLCEMVDREISRTAFGEKYFGISFSDEKESITLANAEVTYYSDMFAIIVAAAPRGKKIQHEYEGGDWHTITLRLTCFAIKSINDDPLEKALKKLRGK